MKDQKIKKLALFAAAGPLPLLAIRQAQKENIPLVIIGFQNISEFEKLSRFRHVPLYRTQIGYFKEILRILRKEKVDSILIIGKIKKVNLFKVLKLDLTTLKLFLGLRDRSDTSLLQGVIDFFERQGLSFVSQKEYFRDLIAPANLLSRKKCSKKERADLVWSFQMAKKLADLNIGQSMITGSRVVVSVEGMEGTDEMIRRSRDLILKQNYFIKVSRPGHNPKYDLPVFGLTTLRLLHRIKVNVIGLEAGMVLIPDMEKVKDYADQHGMTIYGI